MVHQAATKKMGVPIRSVTEVIRVSSAAVYPPVETVGVSSLCVS